MMILKGEHTMKKPLTLDEQISRAQDKVIKCKERLEKYQKPYDDAMDELRALLMQRKENRDAALIEAVDKSVRSFDEILAFIQSYPGTWDDSMEDRTIVEAIEQR